MVQGSGFEVYCPLIGMKTSYEWGMRNEAARVYMRRFPMVAFHSLVTSHKSLVTRGS